MLLSTEGYHRPMRARTAALSTLALSIVTIGTGAFTRPERVSGLPLETGDRTNVGMIEGTVRVAVAPESAPPALSPYARRRYRPPAPSAPTPGSPVNVVVYVLPAIEAAAAAPLAPAEATIEQRNRAIVPHVTAIQRGARVQFPNRDDVFHNLFSLSETRPFNLGRYPPGESRSVTFPRAGIVRMFCDIHSEMGGTILVLDTWLFTQPDASGAYRITGVPEGRHRVVAWHDAQIADTVTVTVTSSAVARADFDLSD